MVETAKKRAAKKAPKMGVGPGPIIVLVDPQMGENIGAAARAMLNFGLTGLRLVRPRDGWPNERAGAMAAGASPVIDAARVFDTVAEATADCTHVIATTARSREIFLPVHDPASAAAAIKPRIDGGEKCAYLFGGEASGLSTEDVSYAQSILTIPVNPGFSSLNLGQAVLLAAYEWAQVAESGEAFESRLAEATLATRQDMDGLNTHLNEELEKSGYFYPPEKTQGMQRNLRAMLARADLTKQEVHTFRGVIKALVRGRTSSKS